MNNRARLHRHSQSNLPEIDLNSSEFATVERIVEILLRQGRTQAGYPVIRPSDCRSAINALDRILYRHRSLFRYQDNEVIDRFFSIGEKLRASQLSQYPVEQIRLNAVLADAYLASGNATKARELLRSVIERPYLIEDADTFSTVIALFAQAATLKEKNEEDAEKILGTIVLLARLRPWSARQIFADFAPLLGTLATTSKHKKLIGRRTAMLSFYGAALSRTRRSIIRQRIMWPINATLHITGAIALLYEAFIADRLNNSCSVLLSKLKENIDSSFRETLDCWIGAKTRPRAKGAFLRTHVKQPEPLVTRAMGGIGDLLMMTPGLKALSLRLGHPIKLATRRQFHPIFANNPFVQLLDIDAEPLSVAQHQWINLSICPAARYEARQRPRVRKGRVELFAKALGVSKRELLKSGTDIVINLSADQKTFAARWLGNSGALGGRPRIGVQPFSRETYRDYPGMAECVRALAEENDVVVFHHQKISLDGLSVTSTAGLTLTESFAILSEMDVLISVDSALLHAAGAFNIPVVAVFGPIDGNIRVTHLRRAVVLDATKEFGCAPCWRNEDQECLVTQQLGTSACMTSVPTGRILSEVNAILQKRQSPPSPKLTKTQPSYQSDWLPQ